jgi:hypothetical protein
MLDSMETRSLVSWFKSAGLTELKANFFTVNHSHFNQIFL